jgi:hypothetical protein
MCGEEGYPQKNTPRCILDRRVGRHQSSKRCGRTDSVARYNLAWHDFSPVYISIVESTACHFVSRFEFVSGILPLDAPHSKEESQCEEVDELYNADQTKPDEEAADAAEVT